ncbi:LysR family transcriptional regulator [Ramlibacter sp. Leaf400]|uniref:LysR family transcriptional regulator n=1 Tax=Ramlibacter sp. Leaf400 TaxID=1736365 RepID=UPI000701E3EC|nr:LysR family transcriptional regulator [Ramlibacter sp. Leaf400]KQT11638.1 LysR family transcriptional regulator [Ramlibacter sp. Leaf400]
MESRKVESLWSHLHWLVVLGEHKSFTAAAARLGVSKAAMSQHIAELERATGVSLVQRTTRSVRLTEAGEQLVDHTRDAFARIAGGFAGVRDLAATPRGLLRVTAPVAFARQQLVPRLPEFLRAYPDVRLELDMSDRLRSLAPEGFDLAVRHTAAPPDTHVAWKLAPTRAVLVASRAYLRRRGTPQTPGDLGQHACLHYPRPEGAPAWTFVAAAARGGSQGGDAVTVPISGPLAVNNSEALRDAAAAGLGIALMPDFSAQSALEAGKLVEVLPRWRSIRAFGDSLYAIRPYSSQAHKAVQVFVAFLQQSFGAGFTVK